MQDHIFRAYDIRGIVGKEFFIEDVYDCACAAALYMKETFSDVKTIAIGMDGRIHSSAIKEEWARGFLESGISIIDIGLCPTPVVAFSEYVLPVQGACMITASHNPKEYNGIKLFLHKKPLFSDAIQTIAHLFKKKARLSIDASNHGTSIRHDLLPKYIEQLIGKFPHLVGCDMSIVFDAGNGAVGAVLPELCKQFQWGKAMLLCTEVDGLYPHHEADPSVESNLSDVKEVVINHGIDLGIAFDGDGDRMGAVTHTGRAVAGDQLLALFAQYVLRDGKSYNFVCDSKCSTAVQEVIEQCGGRLIFSPSGHAFLRKSMEEERAIVAGELSCHFFFGDRYFGFDDGIYAALRLIELVVESQKTLESLVCQLPQRRSSPELRIPCGQGMGPTIVEAIRKKISTLSQVTFSTIDGVRVETVWGWGIIRSSNTQPVISLRYESSSEEGLKQMEDFFICMLQPWYTQTVLKNLFRT